MVITMVPTLLLTATSAALAKTYYLTQSEAGHQVLLLSSTFRSSTLLSGKKGYVTYSTCHPKLHHGLMISVMGNQVPAAIYQTIVNSSVADATCSGQTAALVRA
jgi:hypothetical protein